MKKTFCYERRSNSGNYYPVTFTVEVTRKGILIINDCYFSLRETLNACLDEIYTFVEKAMADYNIKVETYENRVNHGHKAHPINRKAAYYNIDGKLYRCDKHLTGRWVAPVSDLWRILVELANGADDSDGLFLPSL